MENRLVEEAPKAMSTAPRSNSKTHPTFPAGTTAFFVRSILRRFFICL
jgi:hypothetical protein